jgi:gamma-glutamylcyclotransferase
LTLYFAYGSNLSSAQMHASCPGHRFLGPARLDGRRLEFRRRSRRWGGGAADIAVAPAESVWGALYELPDGAVDALDAREGAGFAYRRIEVEVDRDGERVAAVAYEVADKEPAELPPTAGYVEALIGGARERGLPETYVAWLEGKLEACAAS